VTPQIEKLLEKADMPMRKLKHSQSLVLPAMGVSNLDGKDHHIQRNMAHATPIGGGAGMFLGAAAVASRAPRPARD